MSSALYGFLTSLGLIVAIGAQNAFVLKQGLKQQHVLAICLCCAISDAILIAFGVFGFSKILSLHPLWIEIARYIGVIFLVVYGLQHFYQAWKNQYLLVQAVGSDQSLGRALILSLGFTWLNPHVYLDTVILIGSLSTQYASPQLFALGAMTASFLFFFSLGYAAQKMNAYMQNPQAWRVLDLLIGVIMLCIAWGLLQD